MEDYYTPDWWDNWSKRNLKKKARVLSRRLKQLNREKDNSNNPGYAPFWKHSPIGRVIFSGH